MSTLDALITPTGLVASSDRTQQRPFGPAFRELYERHFRFIYRIVTRLAGPDADVEDLVHEIFSVAGQKLPEFEGRAKESTWLYRIAANVVSADRRKRRRQRLLGLRWLKPLPEDELVEGPDRDVERSDAQKLVHDVLSQMSEKKRTVFVLFELEGLPGQEIAEMVGCPLDTMWTRLFHARRDFRKRLADRGITSSADLECVPGDAG